MSTLVTGGTGWIGSHLIAKLDGPVHVVSRNAQRARDRLGKNIESVIEGELANSQLDPIQGGSFQTVINLMGDSLAEGRWTDQKKATIRNSRVNATQNLVASLLKCQTLPTTLVSASAIGWYGEKGDVICEETMPAGDDFLATLCEDWESATRPLADAGVRVVNIRIGVVLGKGGGAAEKLLTPFRLGLGGRLGSGKQWMSWIHLDDLVAAISFLAQHGSIRGPVNLVAPHPVRNKEFTRSLAKALHRPAFLPVPATLLRLVLGEFADYLIASQRVKPTTLIGGDFEFQFPTIDAAWQQIVS